LSVSAVSDAPNEVVPDTLGGFEGVLLDWVVLEITLINDDIKIEHSNPSRRLRGVDECKKLT